MVNVIGTLNVFEVARKRRDLVKRIVYASSAAVFGPEEAYGGSHGSERARPCFPEHTMVFSSSATKATRAFTFQTDGIPSVGIRPWAVYGVGRDQGISSGPTKAHQGRRSAASLQDRLSPAALTCSTCGIPHAFSSAARSGIFRAPRPIHRAEVLIRVEEFIRTLEEFFAAGAWGSSLPRARNCPSHRIWTTAPCRADWAKFPTRLSNQGIRETADIFERLEREGRLEVKDLES